MSRFFFSFSDLPYQCYQWSVLLLFEYNPEENFSLSWREIKFGNEKARVSLSEVWLWLARNYKMCVSFSSKVVFSCYGNRSFSRPTKRGFSNCRLESNGISPLSCDSKCGSPRKEAEINELKTSNNVSLDWNLNPNVRLEILL